MEIFKLEKKVLQSFIFKLKSLSPFKEHTVNIHKENTNFKEETEKIILFYNVGLNLILHFFYNFVV